MSEQSVGFEIQPVIDQTPFENVYVSGFFEKWCKANDHLTLRVVNRSNLEKKESILEENGSDKKILYLPDDLQLHEMVAVMEVVDMDTFKDNPERQQKAKEKMVDLGETFRDAGVYIAQRLGVINEGKGIAKNLAEQLFNYGESLVTGKKADKPKTVEQMARMELTSEKTRNVDHLLAGDKLYESREMIVKGEMNGSILNRNKLYESERQKTLAQFFRVSQKAFDLREKSRGWWLTKTGKVEPWQSDISVHEAFIKNTEKSLTEKIEIPRAELSESIFRRGMDLLAKYMPFDKLPKEVKDYYLYWQDGEKTLREALKIDRLKWELAWTRENEGVKGVSQQEREKTDLIQEVVSKYQYNKDSNNPSRIINSQEINCLGASILGGSLMQEMGLNYLVAVAPNHSFLFLVTADGQVELRDMLDPSFNKILKDEDIDGLKENGKPLTVADIVDFSKNPKPEGLMFDVKGDEYLDKIPKEHEGKRQYISIFGPEYGQKISLLTNLGNFLRKRKSYKEAAEAYREGIRLGPKMAYLYIGLGLSLEHLNRSDEAIEVYREGIKLDPNNGYFYDSLGVSLNALGRYKEAIDTYYEGIKVDASNRIIFYHLADSLNKIGQTEYAMAMYQKFVNLADETKYEEQVGRARSIIREYKK